MFTDPSCYHAALAALLNSVTPGADPSLVLGGNAASAVRLGADGELDFSDPLDPLSATLTGLGYHFPQHPLRGPEDFAGALAVLGQGRSIAVPVDSFHLQHYWVGHGRSHALHVVVLGEYCPDAGTVRLTDPGDVVFFDDRVALSELDAALYSEDAGQAWLELDASRARPVREDHELAAALRLRAAELCGDGSGWLSGTELLGLLDGRLETYLDVVRNRPRGGERQGTQLNWELDQWLPLGLWWYHHTLRWFARHLTALAEGGRLRAPGGLAASVERAAHDVLVVRNLMLRLSVMPEDNPRARTFRAQLDTRLASARKEIEAAGTGLLAQAEAIR